ncbi:class I poly(R)-hydroxyalkanoic acid synthase [Marinobacter daepoensis]|uniref:Class I poly(R)-hydroxyalkanoic acid synthase n=1 Tax=Marinobacter daepoensis TaxID=262077 RepID=A0ABS3BF01_9GAMM|nr:class I poly(R)-hydroxyalkanoic acid synthase [Marinobacter daepoensis]MBN7769461.1 class I poly(R)-hydroxyalkanoic acid synthase [Marinobacter daepoensis]MBY6078151.1 class I poly(R)-hydroxyalkanoic acid synthase [Marinobacter daepoensis]
MFGLEFISKTASQLVNRFETNVRQGQQQLEKWLGDTGLIDDTKISTLSEISDAYRAMAEDLFLHPLRFVSAELDLTRKHLGLARYTFIRLSGKPTDPIAVPDPDDRRFLAEDWHKHLSFDVLQQAYLINSRAFLNWVEGMEGLPGPGRDQLLFYARQLTSALSPSNYPLTNPEVLRITWERKGMNLVDGARNLAEDVRQNPNLFNVGMTDRSAFEVGVNLATTPGKVVYQNELMQLIQYNPTTDTVARRPVLIVPPWINKFYILDLTERNSFIRWLMDQGQTVFVVSWRNPGPAQRDKGWDDYMMLGPLAAADAVTEATGEQQMNAIGYCIGGTLLGTTMAWLEKRKRQPFTSTTYLTTLLDFSDPGGIGVFINDHSIRGIERTMARKGYLDGRAMAFTFNLLRENDLFWSYWTNNYLKGLKPKAFDLLYWNTDGTNLPARMHSYYLREMYLHNRLVEPDALTIAGESINLSQITVPSFFLSARQDHIAKWKTTYKGASVYGGDVRFVLSGSGHIAGVINPPYKEKYGYWTNDQPANEPDAWFDQAEHHPGSWWPHWRRWLATHEGEQVKPRIPGDHNLEVIEEAPGSYVKIKAAEAGRC